MDLTIEGNAYINGSFEPCCIGVDQGKISSIKKILKGDVHLNFGRRLILPAGVDLHVHFRDPGFTHKEDFSTGSKAAAFGGITCVFDMPNTKPQTTTVRAILEKINIAKKKSFVDFGVYAAIADNNITCINEMSKHCSGFKIFLGNTTNSLHLSKKKLRDAIHAASQTNKITLVHAENDACLKKHKITEQNLKDHLMCRPSECEEQSIKNVLNDSKNIRSRIHVCHLSSCEGFELLRKKPKNISVGATPHHLFFDIDSIKSKQSLYKVNPPIRSHFDREALWYGITNGFIDVLESDHAPHMLDEKSIDFNAAPSGLPGVETLYPLFLAKVKQGHMSFAQLLSLLCERPAEIMNIPKGKIEVGRDADFIIIDYKEITSVKSENLHSKCGWTPFEGMPAIFPSDVFLRGRRIIEECQLASNSGIGNNVVSGVQ
jgi:dihydroorotase